MRYVTFYYDLIRHIVLGLKVHEDKEKALKCFNSEFHKWFAINTKFKADEIPVAYGYPTRKYYGVSARTFKKMFDISDISVDESYGDNTDKKMFDISVDESYGDNKEKFMKKWNKPEIVEVTKKEVTAKVESLTPEQIHAAAIKIGEERIKNEKRSN